MGFSYEIVKNAWRKGYQMLFAASVFTVTFKKQCQEMKEQESDKVEQIAVTGEETKNLKINSKARKKMQVQKVKKLH